LIPEFSAWRLSAEDQNRSIKASFFLYMIKRSI